MAATCTTIKKTLILLLLCILLFTPSLLTTNSTFAKQTRLHARMIHRDSIHSSYYNASDLLYDRVERYLKSSIARFAFLAGKKTHNKNTPIIEHDDYESRLTPDGLHVVFMANISVGSPPIPQLLIIDTGSSLLWFQCLPCTKCFSQLGPIFDPSKSSSYKNLSCHDPYCFGHNPNNCDPLERCVYTQTYFDGLTTIGNLAYETLTFESSDEGTNNFSDILVGCGHENVANKFSQPSGIIGLGSHDSISLVFRLGSKFSYCIGSINDYHYAYNNLILGEGAVIQGMFSPLEAYEGLYYVSLEGISVGSTRLEINPNVFKRSDDKGGEGGVVIDSGTTLTCLFREAFEPLRKEVERVLTKRSSIQRVPNDEDFNSTTLCFVGIIKNYSWFPTVTFHFAEEAKLELDIHSMFLQTGPDEFCMSVIQSPSNMPFSIIGIWAQQGYNVGYDHAQYKISFYQIDCQLLES